MWHVWETEDMRTRFWWWDRRKENTWSPRLRWEDNIKMDF